MLINRAALLDALSLAFKAVDPRASGPTAEVRFTGGQIPCLEATDGRIGLILPLVDGLGAAEAPGMLRRIVLDVLKLAPGETVDVSGLPPERFGAGNGVRIVAGTYEAELIGSAVADFPDLPYGGEARCRLGVAESRAALRIAARHASRDETRPNIQRICVEPEGGAVALVATDGHRVYRSPACGEAAGPRGVLVRPEALRLALDVAERNGADAVDVARVPDGQPAAGAIVLTAGAGIVVDLPEVAVHAFPDWRVAVGSAPRGAVQIAADRAAWRTACRQAAVAAAVGSNGRPGAPVRLIVADGRVLFRRADVDFGSGSTAVVGAVVKGRAAVALDVRYLAAAVDACASGPVRVIAGPTDRDMVRVMDEAGAFLVICPVGKALTDEDRAAVADAA